jgi:uncharacterized protein (DUF427 family)
MSLTVGTGPFGQAPAGRFNADLPRDGLLYVEPFLRRMRALLDGETVVDSRRVQLVHEHGRLPRCYFPPADVRMDVLEPRGLVSRHDAPLLEGLVTVEWGAMDAWFEEDEPALGHARDPYHRVDALRSSRHVVVSLEGEVLAESSSPTVIYETGLPPRWYLPPGDVRVALEPSELRTTCAYKGHAEYHSARTAAGLVENIAWTYREPLRDAVPVAGLIAFFNERVDLDVDGERRPRPQTAWSRPQWWR